MLNQVIVASKDFDNRYAHIQVQFVFDAEGYHVVVLTEPGPDARPEDFDIDIVNRTMVKHCGPSGVHAKKMFDDCVAAVLDAYRMMSAQPVLRGESIVVDVRDMKPEAPN